MNTAREAAGLPTEKGSKAELIALLRRINQLPKEYATLQEYLEPIDATDVDAVANMADCYPQTL